MNARARFMALAGDRPYIGQNDGAPDRDSPERPVCDREKSVETLERIAIKRNHKVVSLDRVNPPYINYLEQIHSTCWNCQAIPTGPDLL